MATLFNGYRYKDHVLHAEGVSLYEIAEKAGTPCFVYSGDNIENAYNELHQGFGETPHLICYAVKANSNIAILRLFAQLGAGADVVSQGELFRALEAEIPPEKIVFSGVGKTRDEIDYALRKKILCFNIESEQELLQIDVVAKTQRRVASIAIRVNPDVDPKTHPYIATGLRTSKFGIPYRKALDLARVALRLKNVNLIGLGCHIGSQITTIAPFIDATRRMLKLFDQVKKLKPELTHLDLGGGLGIVYQKEHPPSLSTWAQQLSKEVKDRGVTLIVEPGRSLIANAGVLLTRVLYVKPGENHHYIIADSGMNDLLRPSLYGAYHAVLPVQYKRYKRIKASIVGPCCESGDILTNPRRMQNFQQGDLLSIMSAGAYGSSMSSQYNSRPKAAEVLIREGRMHIIRERENLEDLIAKERVPSSLRKAASSA